MKQHLYRSKLTLLVAMFSMLSGVAMGAFFHKETIIVREGVADTPAAMSSINLMVDAGNGVVKTWNTVTWHETMSVVNLLEEVSRAGEIDLRTEILEKRGMVVNSIDGATTNAELNTRWQYWVNNVYEPREPSRYFLKPGDIVVWKYVKEQMK